MFKPLFLAVSIVAAAPAAAQADDLARVRQHFAGVTTMTANFTQTDRAGRTLTGAMTLKRPGRIRFQYERGVPQLIVADNSRLWFIDYSVRQVQSWPIGSSPLAILLDPTKDISGLARVVPTSGDGVLSVEVRDPKHPEYGRITLVFRRDAAAPAGLALSGWVALDSQNNRTTIRLSDTRLNAPVDDNVFRWNDPRRAAARR